MRRAAMLTTAILGFALLSGCDRDPMSEKGFRLPDGDPVAGREALPLHAVQSVPHHRRFGAAGGAA